MPALVEVLESIGCTDVVTYVQSGNAVATSSLRPAALERAVHDALRRTGLDVPVMVRTARDLRAVVDGNPFPDADPKRHHVGFLSARVAASALPDDEEVAPEQVRVGPARTLYLHYAEGVQRSRLERALTARRLGVTTTARNWTTVLALRDLVGS
jgi:uncharacterized protein (DUF1697 family)